MFIPFFDHIQASGFCFLGNISMLHIWIWMHKHNKIITLSINIIKATRILRMIKQIRWEESLLKKENLVYIMTHLPLWKFGWVGNCIITLIKFSHPLLVCTLLIPYIALCWYICMQDMLVRRALQFCSQNKIFYLKL